ncbi:hypothetical protein ACVINW_003829 [Bradyrhizobium sp. USDA 4461]
MGAVAFRSARPATGANPDDIRRRRRGALYSAIGVLAGVLRTRRNRCDQVVEANLMVPRTCSISYSLIAMRVGPWRLASRALTPGTFPDANAVPMARGSTSSRTNLSSTPNSSSVLAWMWCILLDGTDACFATVLDPLEAAARPHNVARRIYTTVDGILQVTWAPRFSATASAQPYHVPPRGSHTYDVLFQPSSVHSNWIN